MTPIRLHYLLRLLAVGGIVTLVALTAFLLLFVLPVIVLALRTLFRLRVYSEGADRHSVQGGLQDGQDGKTEKLED